MAVPQVHASHPDDLAHQVQPLPLQIRAAQVLGDRDRVTLAAPQGTGQRQVTTGCPGLRRGNQCAQSFPGGFCAPQEFQIPGLGTMPGPIVPTGHPSPGSLASGGQPGMVSGCQGGPVPQLRRHWGGERVSRVLPLRQNLPAALRRDRDMPQRVGTRGDISSEQSRRRRWARAHGQRSRSADAAH